MGRSSTWDILQKDQPKRRWLKRFGCLGLILLMPPVILGIVAEVYFRHVPYAIHAEDALPPQQGPPNQGLWIRYLGVAGYEISDGTTTVLLDPTPTRPRPTELFLPLNSDPLLEEPWCPAADYILVGHPHHDHSLDVPAIAKRTGAHVYGSTSTCNLAQSRGVATDKTHVVKVGDQLTLGTFTVTVGAGKHVPILGMDPPFAGEVSADAGALWFWQFGLDETINFHLQSEAGNSVWFHPTVLYEKGELADLTADVLIYGVNGEPLKRTRTHEIVKTSGASLVLPTHYDNFFHPLNAGLALFPDVDLDEFRRHMKSYNRENETDVRWAVMDYGQRVHVPPPAE